MRVRSMRVTTRIARRAAFVCMAALVVGASTAGPVSADEPTPFNDSETFVDVNPCSGQPDRITVNFAGHVHEHGDRFVAHIVRTGTTSSGFVMEHGVQHRQSNGRVETVTFHDRWHHPDGSAFTVRGLAVFDPYTFDARVDRFWAICRR